MKKIIIFLFLIILSSLSVNAENWLSTNNVSGSKVYLDADSILHKLDGSFFNVKYYDEKSSQDIVCTMFVNGTGAEVVSTRPLSQYSENTCSTKDAKRRYNIKAYTKESPIYNACKMVLEANPNASQASGSSGKSYATGPVAGTGSSRPTIKPVSGRSKAGISSVREPDFEPYLKELQRCIKKNWEPPKGNKSNRVVLLFKIGKDGRLLSNRVHKSSGSPEVDAAALRAVETTAPFRPLPEEFKGQSIDIQFTFDYNVYGAKN